MKKAKKQKQKKTAKSAVRSKPKPKKEQEPEPKSFHVTMAKPKSNPDVATEVTTTMIHNADSGIDAKITTEHAGRHHHTPPNKKGYTLVDGVWVKNEDVAAETISEAATQAIKTAAETAGIEIDSIFDAGFNGLVQIMEKMANDNAKQQEARAVNSDAILITLRDISESLKNIVLDFNVITKSP